MLWTITGGIGSGKSVFAEELARTVGHEGIRLSCSPFPGNENRTDSLACSSRNDASFLWAESDADDMLANKLNSINLESNIFRADRRVLLLDSLSGWLRGLYYRIDDRQPEAEDRIEAAWEQALKAIFSFEGKLIVVTEEAFGGLSVSARELSYARRLSKANRRLTEESKVFYRMTSGMATEVKGYRINQAKGVPNE
ncbi:bifunctional adenosylcobinamide kinase/adenosylcobinamide-phosphate guanylyltransferase [Cohnella endophytica]|nr:bifunctional adenosylcobinamide kinase/adenosylcobinamide-phosphate guanylyltransferase [Cohnella endophytica]